MSPVQWRQVPTKTWFSADLNLGDADVIEQCERPFASVEQMNETIIARWNARVASDDTAWLLGDVATTEALHLLTRLHGHKYLVAGTRDTVFHGRKLTGKQHLADQVARYRAAGFTAVVTGEGVRRSGHAVRVPLLGGPPFGHPVVLVSHFPYAVHEYAPRPPKRGPRPWLVCGQARTEWAIDAAQRQLNVGVDVWDFAPVEAAEVAALIKDFTPENELA